MPGYVEPIQASKTSPAHALPTCWQHAEGWLIWVDPSVVQWLRAPHLCLWWGVHSLQLHYTYRPSDRWATAGCTDVFSHLWKSCSSVAYQANAARSSNVHCEPQYLIHRCFSSWIYMLLSLHEPVEPSDWSCCHQSQQVSSFKVTYMFSSSTSITCRLYTRYNINLKLYSFTELIYHLCCVFFPTFPFTWITTGHESHQQKKTVQVSE